MSSVAIATIVFVCVLGGVLLGMSLRAVLPEHHLSDDSKDVVKLGIGMIATMTALILGLVTASTKSAFDAQSAAVRQAATNIVMLDRILVHYGPETKAIRDGMRSLLASRVDMIWPEESHASGPPRAELPKVPLAAEGLQDQLLALSPQTDAQRWLQSRALQIAGDLLQARWFLFGPGDNSVPVPFLVVLVCWLALIFGSFGLFAPRNATVITVLFVCALSVAAAILLVLEMEQPFAGLMKISSVPLRNALSHLGQ